MANNQKNLDDFFKKSHAKEEPEGLKEYISDLNQGVDPSKLTFADRIAGFRSVISRIRLSIFSISLCGSMAEN